jgi:ATP-dependent DNA helicase RecG
MALLESKDRELKVSVSKSFLKTVSAYANYRTGSIIFGMADDGTIVGLPDIDKDCLRVEHMIHDSIDPRPRYAIEVDSRSGTMTLTVFEGPDKPYLYERKAYIRNDSSTIEADPLELKRLVLAGKHMSFDQLPADNQKMEFGSLKQRLHDRLGVDRFDRNTLRTLGLADADGQLVNAAALLSDSNPFPGIDVMRFGESTSEILERARIGGCSVLDQLDRTIGIAERNYTFEKVTATTRERSERLPLDALRETLANAIAHRAWDVPATITVAMHPDRVVVTSPGSLPSGIEREAYLAGGLSVPRNPTLATVMFRLGYIELFGSGVPRIREAYPEGELPPRFDVLDASIRVTLPTFGSHPATTVEEKAVLNALPTGMLMSRKQIANACDMSLSTTGRLLASLELKNLVERSGRGRGTKYSRRA